MTNGQHLLDVPVKNTKYSVDSVLCTGQVADAQPAVVAADTGRGSGHGATAVRSRSPGQKRVTLFLTWFKKP